MAITPLSRDGADALSKALHRFRREDPTFHVTTDEETGETIIAGMGELHLEIYVERIRREYKVEVEVGAPKVSYREAPTKPAEFNSKHKKQTGGSGQYAHIVGKLECAARGRRGRRSSSRRTSSAAAFPRNTFRRSKRVSATRWPRARSPSYPIVGVKAILEDGSYHDVDSSDMAFQICARNCFRETFPKTKPVLLEPVMKIEIECPTQFQGLGGRRIDQPPRHDRVDRGERQHGHDRRRSAAGRDVRLLDRPAQHDARAGHVHDGVLPSTAACRRTSRKRSSPNAKPNSSPPNAAIEHPRTAHQPPASPGTFCCAAAVPDGGTRFSCSEISSKFALI